MGAFTIPKGSEATEPLTVAVIPLLTAVENKTK
jgi:hypothetical protein